MSVNSYLENLANRLIIRDDEKTSIKRSFDTLKIRLEHYFGSKIRFVKKFGSYHRETILPRRYDCNSDIDVLINFADGSYQPQTYLNYLRKFVEHWYSRSEIYQSNPTIVLELNHIKFELVPCINASWYEDGNYKIPSKSSDYQKWISTSPFDFNNYLIEINKIHNYKIKQLIRVIKRWNVNTRYSKIYESFELEQKIARYSFSPLNVNLRDYFYDFVINMSWYDLPYQYQRNEVEKLVNKVKEVRKLESLYPIWAENEIKIFFE